MRRPTTFQVPPIRTYAPVIDSTAPGGWLSATDKLADSEMSSTRCDEDWRSHRRCGTNTDNRTASRPRRPNRHAFFMGEWTASTNRENGSRAGWAPSFGRARATPRWFGFVGSEINLDHEIVVVSPHLDDAVLSPGASLTRMAPGDFESLYEKVRA